MYLKVGTWNLECKVESKKVCCDPIHIQVYKIWAPHCFALSVIMIKLFFVNIIIILL